MGMLNSWGVPSSARGASNGERLVLSVRSTPERLLLSLFCVVFHLDLWLEGRLGTAAFPPRFFSPDFPATRCGKSLNRLLPARFSGEEGGNSLNSCDKSVLENLFRGPGVK